ncbi:hypothetical protein FH968_10710 [Buttiauxella sp. B2]|uniref:LuxR C-terminal-related transcriptional regulator n=1 Tax=Buttiauxella sp. B2 TaxID=2587812 RepID=UPI001124A662|nr:LuxR C-terminal-related transcriptional regulator [Buttiauxella sp. B2]TNV20466.1 hypothetical protein FH968_10710 [Buttiauxella sp. B2]
MQQNFIDINICSNDTYFKAGLQVLLERLHLASIVSTARIVFVDLVSPGENSEISDLESCHVFFASSAGCTSSIFNFTDPVKFDVNTYFFDRRINIRKLYAKLSRVLRKIKLGECNSGVHNPMPCFDKLTLTQYQIITHVLNEMSTSDISRNMSINKKIVSQHKINALTKLNVKNVCDLINIERQSQNVKTFYSYYK